jgi:glycosyltransferase involved in cell wall biosynthesis
MYHLMRQLAKWHQVHLLTYDEGNDHGDISGLEPFLGEIRRIPRSEARKHGDRLGFLLRKRSYQTRSHYSDAMQAALDEMSGKLKIDTVIVEFSQMNGFRFPDGVRLVLDEHNVEYDLLDRMARRDRWSFRRLLKHYEVLRFRPEEIEFVRRADLTLATSERDASLLRECVPERRTAVITNGVDCREFARPDIPRAQATGVFVGATHGYPNEDGVLFFLDRILPFIRAEIPEFKMYIVGGRPPASLRERASNQVVVTGFVDDVKPYMWENSVFVVPLRMGGGTRFKVVEALAASAPTVSTSLGAEGIPVHDEQEIRIADEPEAFAEAVIDVLRHPAEAQAMANRGRDFVRSRYDWKVIGENLHRELEALAARG